MIKIDDNLFLGSINDLYKILDKVSAHDLIINCSTDLNYQCKAKIYRIPVNDDCSQEAFIKNV